MPDRHLNLFYPYGDAARWEDNFTRAFLIALQSLAPVHFLLFVRDMLLDSRHQELRDKIDLRAAAEPVLDLQVSGSSREGDPPLTSENGVLVTIDATAAEELALQRGDPGGGSRVDALVAIPDADLTAVIEVKLGDNQSVDQLARHHRAFFDTEESRPEDVHVAIRWQDVVEYLDSLHRQSVSNLEQYVLGEFVDFADEMGLAPFAGLSERDFREPRPRNLRKLLRLLVVRFGPELALAPDRSSSHRLDFTGISENVWIDYPPTPSSTLRISVVAGVDGIWHARRFKAALASHACAFREVGTTLLRSIQHCLDEPSVAWRPKTRLFASRGLQSFPPASRFYTHPDEFDTFVNRMLDDRYNPCAWIARREAEERLGEELEGRELPRDAHGVYPPWEGKEQILMNSFFHLEILVPSSQVVGLGREETVQLLATLLSSLREAARTLNELKHAPT